MLSISRSALLALPAHVSTPSKCSRRRNAAAIAGPRAERIARRRRRPLASPLPALPPEIASAVPPSAAQAAEAALTALATPSPGLAAGAAANTLVYLLGIKVLRKGLTWEGVLSSWFLGTLVFAAFGAGGYAIVCLYFLLGTLVTKVKLAQKQAEGIAEARSGRRGLGSVLGSGFAGIVCAAAALLTGNPGLWQVGFVASFASKLADTTSSEIGKAYGKTTYLITTLERVKRGTEGAVSLEGTAAGVVAAAGVAVLAVALGQVTWAEAAVVAAAAAIANLLESYIGALEQGKAPWLTNDVVNVIQISIAALLAMAGTTALL